MAIEQVDVPDIGGAEAEVIEVLVAVGDEVSEEQPLIVMESDKASMEIPSTAAGTVVEVLAKVGDELAEGAAVIRVETGDAASSEAPAEAQPAAEAPAPEAETSPPAPSAAPEPAATPEELAVEVPDIGTDEAVELIEIVVAVGDTVAEGDSLVVLESDKASMEVPSPAAGEISAITVSVGDEVRQGDKIAVLLSSSAAVASEAPKAAPSVAPEPAPAPKPAEAAPAAAKPEAPAAATPAETSAATRGGEVYAGPAVRKLAREFGVDLAQVTGSGPRGRILKEDLHQFVQQALAQPAGGGAGLPEVPEVDFAAFGPVEHEARSRIDKVTAENMQRSWLNVPHVTQFDDVDITELEAFRKSLKAEAESRGTRLTPMPFLLKAVAVALRDNPKFRASLADGGETLVFKQYTHVGMAVDTPAGLVVPVIRDVDQKSIWQLAEEVLDMAARARDRKLKPADMQGGCFTIFSLGNIGGRGFTPIVNTPEVGILGVSRASVQPVWNGSEFEPRTLLPIALSYDHRVINGGDGGRFMARLSELLGDIRRLVM